MPAARVIVTDLSQVASDSAAVNRWDLPGARRGVLLVACWCILFLSAIGRSSTAAGSSWLAVISIVPVATAAPQTVLSVLGRLVVG
jgi:hypothetical protein